MVFYTVERGTECDETLYTEKCYSPNDKKILFCKLSNNDANKNFGGCYHSLTVRVSYPVKLSGLVFFGPFMEKTADYIVRIEGFEPRKSQIIPISHYKSRKIQCRKKVVNVKRGERFYVEFDTPWNLCPNTWYLIEFELSGPDTEICETIFGKKEVLTNIGTITFEFGNSSMKQVPELRFQI